MTLLGAAALAITPEHATVRAADTPTTSAIVALVTEQEEQLIGEGGSKYHYIVVRDVRPATRRSLRALVHANPRSRVLLYTNAGFMVHDLDDPKACGYWPFNGDGVDYCRATKRHEGWFLHRTRSPGESRRATRLRSSAYPASWAADIGDPGYQRTWIRSVKRRLRGRGPGGTRVRVAGVFMDDLNLRPGHGMDGLISEYGDEAYGDAAVGFGTRVARELARAGYVTMANVGMDVHDSVENQKLLTLATSGVRINREYFVRYHAEDPLFTTPAGTGPDWLSHLEQFEAVQAAGGDYMAMTYGSAPRPGTELAAARYARATFLLGWDGSSESALAYRTTDGTDPADFDSWQVDIGSPIEGRSRVSERQVWTRRYSEGIALVNADPSESHTIVLDALYRSGEGLCTPTLVLPPASGRVLPRC